MRRIQKFWKEQSTFHGKEVEKKEGEIEKGRNEKIKNEQTKNF